MQQPLLGQIAVAAFPFAPSGWALCNGALLPVAQYGDLFDVIGYAYGGSGGAFALPDLRGRAAAHPGRSSKQGGTFGVETVTLMTNQIPPHTHQVRATDRTGDSTTPVGHTWARSSGGTLDYVSEVQLPAFMRIDAVQSAGQGRAHENMPPFLVLNFLIAVKGTKPSRAG